MAFLKDQTLPIDEKKFLLNKKRFQWESERVKLLNSTPTLNSCLFFNTLTKDLSGARVSPYRLIKKFTSRCKNAVQGLNREEKTDLHLQTATFLHDIGHSLSSPAHHKKSYSIISTSRYLPFNVAEREIIGSIARNHRKKPDFSDKFLTNKDIYKIKILSGILRCADGMEIESYEYVDNFIIKLLKKKIVFTGPVTSSNLLDRFIRKSKYLCKLTGLDTKYITN